MGGAGGGYYVYLGGGGIFKFLDIGTDRSSEFFEFRSDFRIFGFCVQRNLPAFLMFIIFGFPVRFLGSFRLSVFEEFLVF